ncbi:MAG: MlaD family protein [Planctomycetota bacterium]
MANGTGYSNAEVKAGVFLTLCLALFVVMLFVYGKAARIWHGRQEISVIFTSVTSLRHDAPVRYNGVEVGCVKDIQILHLNKDNISRLPAFKINNLDDLPLTEKEQKTLRNLVETPADKFQKAVEDKLENRTMIKLTLEVLQGRDAKRYRIDDEIHINTTLMGNTSVEITSGNGDPLNSQNSCLLLGRSGDFFTNLAKSVEQVKEILSSVSDVVGQQERESVRRALQRFDSITARIETIVKLADARLPATWDRVDTLADSAKKNFDRIGETVATVQPQITKTLGLADEAIKDLQERIGKLADEAKTAVMEIKGQVKPVLSDLQQVTSKSKDDFPVLVKNARDLATRLQESAGKLDGVLATSNRLLNESYPDLRRLILSFRMGAENFEEMTNLLKRKPWLIYNKATEDVAYNNAQKMTRDLDIATKRFAELSTELQAVRRNLDKTPQERLERIDFMIQELNILSDTLKFAGDATRKEVLPPFERKKGALVPVADEFDPTFGRKPVER